MTKKGENEILCERLLGWKKYATILNDVHVGYRWRTSEDGSLRAKPTFDDWSSAGLLMDALAKAGNEIFVIRYHSSEWTAQTLIAHTTIPYERFQTGPAAIRAAAIAYVRSLPCELANKLP